MPLVQLEVPVLQSAGVVVLLHLLLSHHCHAQHLPVDEAHAHDTQGIDAVRPCLRLDVLGLSVEALQQSDDFEEGGVGAAERR